MLGKQLSTCILSAGLSTALVWSVAIAQDDKNNKQSKTAGNKQSMQEGQKKAKRVVVDSSGSKQSIKTPVSASGLGKSHPATDKTQKAKEDKKQ